MANETATEPSGPGCRCCDPRCAAVALGRWCIGLIFLFFGIAKLHDVSGFAQNMAKPFEKTWLPAAMVIGFGYVLPFLETGLGALLVLGIYRTIVLFVTGLLLLALTFGQILLMGGQTVFSNTAYLFMTAALLFLDRFDRWVIYPRPDKPQR